MKAAIGSVAVAAAVFVAAQVPMRAAASQAPATTTAKSSTADLDSKIEKRINDSSLKKYDIKVSVNDGVATLKGTVPTEADRRKAAQLATISGIARVDNQLVVDMNTAREGQSEGDRGHRREQGRTQRRQGCREDQGRRRQGDRQVGRRHRHGDREDEGRRRNGVGKIEGRRRSRVGEDEGRYREGRR